MAFYITPPGGNISLQKLTQFAVTRFNFLCKILETKGDGLSLYDVVREIGMVQESECLIEGSTKDRVSHFILRLVCCGNKEMSDFLIAAETLLFDFRFSCMTKDELCKLFKSLDSHLRALYRHKNSNERLAIQTFKTILHTFVQIKGSHSKWRTVVTKYLNGDCDYFRVPFQTVLQFVSKREVILHKGIASVPFCRLRDVVTSLFRELLQHGIAEGQSHLTTEDERLVMLVQTIKHLYRRKYGNKRLTSVAAYSLSHVDVDHVTPFFPPCMSHVHRELRRNHRLKHHTRVQYTLFLKEAGLSVHEALMFWRKEYCMSPSNHAGCAHDWSHDERRYTYSIRHLYGLEGSRINYRGHSCKSLQENFYGPYEEGGCPFSHFDRQHLLALMEAEGIHDNQETIQRLASDGRFSSACKTFFDEKMKGLSNPSQDQHSEQCRGCEKRCDVTLPDMADEQDPVDGESSNNKLFKIGNQCSSCVEEDGKCTNYSSHKPAPILQLGNQCNSFVEEDGKCLNYSSHKPHPIVQLSGHGEDDAKLSLSEAHCVEDGEKNKKSNKNILLCEYCQSSVGQVNHASLKSHGYIYKERNSRCRVIFQSENATEDTEQCMETDSNVDQCHDELTEKLETKILQTENDVSMSPTHNEDIEDLREDCCHCLCGEDRDQKLPVKEELTDNRTTVFSKPVDYYTNYRQLMWGLRDGVT